MTSDLQFSSFKFSNVFVPAENVILGCFSVGFWPELRKMEDSRKGHGILRRIEERTCGSYWGQLKISEISRSVREKIV